MVNRSKVLISSISLCKIILLFLLCLNCSLVKSQGLQFNSNDSLLSKRTSYSVFSAEQPEFSGHLYINFDLSLWDNDHLGYIVNITDDKNNSYSLSSIYKNSPFLNFNIDSKSNKINIPLYIDQLKRNNWMKVKIDFDLKANIVTIAINDKTYKATGFNFDSNIRPQIYFGKNKHYSDVPKMAIRNLTIADQEKKYTFLLNEWKGNNVFDSTGNKSGYVENPVWLINDSYFWMPQFTRTFKEVTGINFHHATQQLLMFKSDSLITYDVQRNSLSARAYKNKLPVPLHLGKSIINEQENKLYAYETLKANKPATSIAALDLNTLKWDSVGNGTIAEQRHHHNIFYDKNGKAFYLFGGYGSYSYYKDFFTYNRKTDTWDKVQFTGDKINPRFFSGYSSVNENNEVYIFGGYGNQSGNQIVGGQHFYDLYKVNLTNHTIKKCWEIKPPAEDFVAANNLIIADNGNYFYAICYAHDKPQTSLRLYKFAIKDGSYQAVSGTIPAKGERIESDINLFFNAIQKTFYCAIQEFTTPDFSTVRVYSLAYPPVSEQEYRASQQAINSASFNYYYIAAAVLILLIILAIIYSKQKIKRQLPLRQEEVESEPEIDLLLPAFGKQNEEKRANAIYLLGEFAAYDKKNRDITYLFSPKIKQLFILVLLNNGNGVISKKISTTLWPDKDVAKTKNIKGVTINHLRNILADIDGIELVFLNDTYSFKISNEFWCDYLIVCDAINGLKNKPVTEVESLLNHIDLITRGGLLEHINEPWLDDIKNDYEENLVPPLLAGTKIIYEGGDYRKTIEVTRLVLNTDPFNDTAIKYKLKALRRIKGIEHAHKVYNEFTAEYERSLGEAYSVPFDKICSVK